MWRTLSRPQVRSQRPSEEGVQHVTWPSWHLSMVEKASQRVRSHVRSAPSRCAVARSELLGTGARSRHVL